MNTIQRTRTRKYRPKINPDTYKPELSLDWEAALASNEDENWQDIDSVELVSHTPSPEDILISKEKFRALSDEAKDLVKLIFNCPSEFFCLDNGRIKKIKFQKYCKRERGWSKNHTELLKFEVGLFLQYV